MNTEIGLFETNQSSIPTSSHKNKVSLKFTQDQVFPKLRKVVL